MIKINSDNLAKEIDNSFREMRFHPMFEEERFAILECNGIQVQVILTKDKDEFCDEIQPNLAAV